MSRDQLLDEDYHPLPYWVRLARLSERRDDAPRAEDPLQALLHLDLMNGRYAQVESSRLARAFEWHLRGRKIGHREKDDYCLILTPIEAGQQDQPAAGPAPFSAWRRRDDLAFRWLPVQPEQAGNRSPLWRG